MARSIEEVVRLQLAQVRAPEQQRLHAAIARRGLAQHLARRRGNPVVETVVDGRRGASEDAVRPFGVIRYEFNTLAAAARFAKGLLEEVSPVLTGRYKAAWFYLAGGVQVTEAALPGLREVTVVNDQPYARRLAVGFTQDGRRWSLKVPPNFLERVRREVMRAHPGVDARITFVALEGAPTVRRRRGRRFAEEQMTYPAIRLSAP